MTTENGLKKDASLWKFDNEKISQRLIKTDRKFESTSINCNTFCRKNEA